MLISMSGAGLEVGQTITEEFVCLKNNDGNPANGVPTASLSRAAYKPHILRTGETQKKRNYNLQ